MLAIHHSAASFRDNPVLKMSASIAEVWAMSGPLRVP